jgi:aminoglycoside 6-adenylyltransferase
MPRDHEHRLAMDYRQALDAIVEWARGESNVRAVVLTGSAAANSQHPLSDRDVELHVQETAPLEAADDWWASLGQVLAVERLANADGQPTRLIYYIGGKLDFTLVSVDDVRGEYDRPFSVLLDKDSAAAQFRRVDRTPEAPDQVLFDECCNWAAAAALMTAKAIVRDEPWSVVLRDSDFKAELLRMIEWDHTLRHGATRDVRYLGTRMRQWMDNDVQDRLSACWATFGGDSQGALLASLDLYQELASRVAARAGLADFHHLAIRHEVDRILAMAPRRSN